MKLREITNFKNNFKSIDIQRMKQWLINCNIENYIINPDGTVDVDGDINLSYLDITSIPLQFGKAKGSFSCRNTKLSSLEGAPSIVGGGVYCANSNIISFTGVDKIIKQMNGAFVINSDVTHVLGLLLIEGITGISISNPIDYIMNKYIGTKDILSCQDELIEAGFKEEARL